MVVVVVVGLGAAVSLFCTDPAGMNWYSFVMRIHKMCVCMFIAQGLERKKQTVSHPH